ncbi:MAG: hypothetical protein II085_02275 [Alphaproteobacteria bacterium]|nr:hypothetical protein [Alphaproteobacteria bacterium]
MKKIIFTLLLLLGTAGTVFASNVMPDKVMYSPVNTFGVYQVGHSLLYIMNPMKHLP